MQSLSDNELVKLYQAGNDASFELLLKRHQQRIFKAIFLIVKNEETANDIFQDTFLKVINKLREGKYSDQGLFVAWVNQIARNLCMDYFRKTKQLAVVHSTDERDVFKNVKHFDVSFEDTIIQKQTSQKLKTMIDLLPPEQKEVVLMRCCGNLSFEEIAALTDMNINSCLGRMRYALRNLRRIMDEKNILI